MPREEVWEDFGSIGTVGKDRNGSFTLKTP